MAPSTLRASPTTDLTCLSPISLGDIQSMSSFHVPLSRLDRLFLAKTAEQAERYHDVIAQLKDIIAYTHAHLTVDERNLLSIAYKNLTGSLRASWRTIETLQKKEFHASTRHQIKLMCHQKDLIEKDLERICHDIVQLLERHLIPAANDDEEKVFYCKMQGDYYRYLAELTRLKAQKDYGKISLEAYKTAYQHAVLRLPATHPTRLGLALNFAVFFHDIMHSPERACHLAKHAFDDAVSAAVADANFVYEDSLMILQLMRDDLILWQGEVIKD